MDYEWSASKGYSVSASDAVKALDEIKDKSGGQLLPRAIVDASRPETAPLHPCFEWDDSKAAENYRASEAGRLIRAIRVIQPTGKDEKTISVRAYLYVDEKGDGEDAYVSMATVMSNDELRQQAVSDVIEDLERAQKKLRQFKELEKFYTKVGAIQDELLGFQMSSRKKERRHERAVVV